MMRRQEGFTFIELIITLGLIVFLFSGIFLAYTSILDTINNAERRTAAISVMNEQLELIRRLPYESVGTVSGLPVGIIPQEQTIRVSGLDFIVKTTIRNIDDPFDGTLGGTPSDTTPADYKLIELTIECPSCLQFVPVAFTGTAAPKALEGATTNGSLFVNVINANGVPLSGANVHVVNQSTTPAIDLTDTTNASGTLKLVSVPTSTQAYQIDVSLPGYSSERTYPLGAAGNPNPINPDATVATQALTSLSFAIDRLSALTVRTSDVVCGALGNENFTLRSSKIIGTGPNVYKIDASLTTNAQGTYATSTIEWDTYSLSFNGSEDILGTVPLLPLVINPSSTNSLNFILKPADPPSLLVTVRDAISGAAIPDAAIALSRSGFSTSSVTGHAFTAHTDWSGGQYFAQSGGVDVDSSVGRISLLLNGGTYSTTTEEWLISNTIDVGSSTTNFYTLDWAPASQPPQTGSDSLRVQIASNNDNTTWNFTGPDGTASTYFTSPGASIPSAHNGNRYMRYRVVLRTNDENIAPQLDDIGVDFRSACVPLSQSLFSGLSLADYTVDVTASGYEQASTTVSVSGNWQQTTLDMVRL